MLTLQNDSLTVTLLDPNADRERFGTRYCTGGYIFQIEDAQHGPVLSGPTYPDSFNTFDGQGIPDAFNRCPLFGDDNDLTNALVPGIGVCDLKADSVTEFADWDVEESKTDVNFRTRHTFENYDFRIRRTVSLHGRTVRSVISVANDGRPQVPIRWFPHPFYPHPDTDVLCKLNTPVTIADDVDGYRMGDDGYIHRKGWPWSTDYYLALDHPADRPLIILQRHPALGQVAALCSYVPALLPIWGNTITFSFEPYFEQTVSAGQTVTWSIDYEF